MAKEVVEYTSIPQVTPEDEREVTITLEYHHDRICVWSNNSTILNRLGELGYTHYAEQTKGGKVLARQFHFPMSMLSQLLKVKLYKLY